MRNILFRGLRFRRCFCLVTRRSLSWSCSCGNRTDPGAGAVRRIATAARFQCLALPYRTVPPCVPRFHHRIRHIYGVLPVTPEPYRQIRSLDDHECNRHYSLGTGNYINPASTGYTLTNGEIHSLATFHADSNSLGDYPVIYIRLRELSTTGATARSVTHSITAGGCRSCHWLLDQSEISVASPAIRRGGVSRPANRLTSATATFSIKSPTTKQPGRTT